MPSPLLPPDGPHGSGFSFSVALPYLAAVATGVLGFFGAQFTAVARLQKTLLDASRAWVEEAQIRHAQDGVLISKKETRIVELEAEVIRYRGLVDSMIAKEDARVRIMERLGFTPEGNPL